jgi:GNAT superfamily N-acetyltransferase
MTAGADVEVRPATPNDRPAIHELLRAALGWGDDERFGWLYTWKHEENPFGASAAWVAFVGDQLAGLRVFMRWELEHPGGVFRAVRAVDTATHPDHQGRGVFRRLTLGAIDMLRDEGVDFVFNTPNSQSLPGYLKMGWDEVGRLPVAARPTGVRGAMRMISARQPAERWSEPTALGVPASELLAAERPLVASLVASQPAATGIRTRLSPELLDWRYGSSRVPYRAVVAEAPENGIAFVRVRRRGTAREVVVATLLVRGADRAATGRLVRAVRRAADADYVLAIGPEPGLVPLPKRFGPVLTWRALCAPVMPPLESWQLRLGDVELF